MTPRTERERIERVVCKELHKQDEPNGIVGIWLSGPDVVRLLRRELAKERARVRGIVEAAFLMTPHNEYARGRRDAGLEILAALSGRKGMR